jgi:uncharacterized protein DUF6602
MGNITREELFRQASAKLRQDFREREVIPHNQLKGDEAAGLVRDFLNDRLPKRFSAGSGFIIDPGDRISKQTDLIIYDAFNCPTYRASETAGIYPSDNVAAIVEVKSVLDKDRLREAHENILAAKRLSKTKEIDTPYLQHRQTLGCVFAFESSITLDKIAEHLKGLYSESGLGAHVDHLVVLDRGVVTLGISLRGSNAWNPMGVFTGTGGPSGEGSHLGILIFEMGEASLDGFFRLLLAHLTFFRHIVPHPGFNLSHLAEGGNARSLYLTPVTSESDPKQREIKIKEYREEYRKAHGIAEPQSK